MTWVLTNDYYMKTMFDGWLSSIIDMDTYTLGYKNDFATDVIIQQLNVDNIPVYGVKLEKAYPLAVNAIDLSNSSENEIAKTLPLGSIVPRFGFGAARSGISTVDSLVMICVKAVVVFGLVALSLIPTRLDWLLSSGSYSRTTVWPL